MPKALSVLRTGFSIASGLFALTMQPSHAEPMVTSTCAADFTIIEGDEGTLMCTVMNNEPYTVYLRGDFGFVFTLSHPDKSDRVTSITAIHLVARWRADHWI